MKKKKMNFIEKAVKWAERRGFKKIKANCEEYETPTQYTRPGEEQVFVPDVTGLQLGTKNYIEVAMKTDKIRRRITKWKLLSTLANMKGGKLFLLAPRGHKAFTEKMVKKHHLNAEVIYLSNFR